MYTLNNGGSLAKLIKKEKNPITLRRLTALSMIHNEVDIDQILKTCNVSRATLISRWLKKWNKSGYDSIVNKKRSGRKPKFTAKQKQFLKDYVLNKDEKVVCRELVELVQGKWGMNCDTETIRRALISMKISWQKPNKQNYKSCPNAKKVFKKATWKR